MKIFISYSTRDAVDFAQQIQRYLASFGRYEVLTDVNGINVGEVWTNATKNKISNCDVFVVIVTYGALQSPHVENEVLQAQKEKKWIIPCFHKNVRDSDIKWGLDKIQGIEFEDMYELARNLYSKIADNRRGANEPVEEPVKTIPARGSQDSKGGRGAENLDMAVATPEISVEYGDITTFDADVVALKYAQNFYGADFDVAKALSKRGVSTEELRPAQGDYRFLQARFSINARYVLFVGVPPLEELSYREIRDFSRKVLKILADDAPYTKHVAMTIHGPGFGLDETESFLAQFGGFIDAFRSGQLPPGLRHISIVDYNTKRVEKLRQILDRSIDNVSNVSRVASPWNYRLVPESPRKKGADEIYSLNPIESAGRKSESKPLIFVAMSFKEEFSDLWTYGIERAIKSNDELRSYGFLCERVDTSHFTGDIMDYVKNKLRSAAVVVAELTGSNPNVYLEVGYAWGIGKPTILLARHDQELMFDVRGQRCLKWKNIQDCEKLLVQELVSLKIANQI